MSSLKWISDSRPINTINTDVLASEIYLWANGKVRHKATV